MERFKKERIDAGKAPATVDRELEGFRRAYTFAVRQTPPRVAAIPYFPLLKAGNARQVFLSRANFEALLGHIRNPDLCDFIEWAF